MPAGAVAGDKGGSQNEHVRRETREHKHFEAQRKPEYCFDAFTSESAGRVESTRDHDHDNAVDFAADSLIGLTSNATLSHTGAPPRSHQRASIGARRRIPATLTGSPRWSHAAHL
eukprot:Amastigsp_a844009_8.p1 type:complete len:115 gc:universal Amastigsp_a844009_8:141-485(+)